MRNPPAAFKHDNPTHKQFGQSGDSSLLRKGYAEGGGVKPEFDPNEPSRAGSRGSAVNPRTGEFGGWKDSYPRQQEVSPKEGIEDPNVIDPEQFMQWNVYKNETNPKNPEKT